jgi:hypothetical protein
MWRPFFRRVLLLPAAAVCLAATSISFLPLVSAEAPAVDPTGTFDIYCVNGTAVTSNYTVGYSGTNRYLTTTE